MSDEEDASLPNYKRETLELAPAAVAKMLSGIAAVPTIRTLLAQAGMRDAAVEEGRQLLLDCLALPPPRAIDLDTPDAKRARDATAELNGLDEGCFQRWSAALKRRAPNVATFVFGDIKPTDDGAEAVKSWATVLTRFDQAESGAAEIVNASKNEIKIALELLAERGCTPAERKRLRALVDAAHGPTSMLEKTDHAAREAERILRLRRLKGWLDDWSTTARTVLKKKAHRIRLGLANRKAPSKKSAGSGGGADDNKT